MNRKKMIWLIYPSFMLITIIAITATALYASVAMKTFFLNHVSGSLDSCFHLTQEFLRKEMAGTDLHKLDMYVKDMGRASGIRITLMAPNGRVIADSNELPEAMENHGDRPEMHAALAGRTGSAIRYSKTLKTDMMYRAKPLMSDDRVIAVLRTSMPVSTIDEKIQSIQIRIGLAGFLTAIITAWISWLISRRVTVPIVKLTESAEAFAMGTLDYPIQIPETTELSRLARSMKKMAERLDAHIRTIQGQRNTLDAVLSSMTEGVIALDPEERIISINPAAAAMLERDISSVLNHRMYEIVRNKDMNQFIDHAIQNPAVHTGDVALYFREKRTLQLHSAPLTDADNMPIGILIVMADVTHLRRLEKVRRDFITNISHEIKTPMTAILGYTETLKDMLPEDRPEITRFFEMIDRNTRHLQSVIDDLITLSRIENRVDRELDKRAIINAKDLIEDVVLDQASAAEENRIRIAVACPPEISLNLNVRFFRRALANLVENAIVHGNPDSTVTVGCEAADGDVLIRVSDTGPGIAGRHLPRVFERFYRIHEGHAKKRGGSGLGLSIARHIILRHGGDISVESVVGRGTTFTVRLPRASGVTANSPHEMA